MTTEAALQEMNRTIGMMLASVDGLRRDFAAADLKSDQRLANVHRRLDDLVDQFGDMETKMERFGDRLVGVESEMASDVRPTVADVRNWKQRGMGALAVTGVASAAIGAFIASFWHEIIAKLTALK